MSDETIPPALTAEEWRAQPFTDDDGAQCGRQWDVSSYDISASELDDGSEAWVMVGSSIYDDARGRHALAALCLYGQPFGFTREDLVDILTAVERLRFRADDQNITRLRSLASRIAALLPPDGA